MVKIVGRLRDATAPGPGGNFMVCIRPTLALLLVAAVLLMPRFALAEPKEPTAEEKQAEQDARAEQYRKKSDGE